MPDSPFSPVACISGYEWTGSTFLKLAANEFSVLFLWEIAFKSLLTGRIPSEYASISGGDLQIVYSFLVRRDSSHAGRQLNQVEAFPVRTVGGHCFCSRRAGLVHHKILHLDHHST